MLALVQGGVVVIAIGILIFVHELGHFLVAKKVGIRVEAFSLGFGPTIWGFTRGDTTYKLSLIPLGGYVKMAGEFKEEGDVDTGEEFFAKTISQRAWVVSAGVIMNILFAIIAFPLAFSIGVPFDAPVIGTVLPGSPAWEAGIEPGDRVTAIDGGEVISFQDVQTSVAFNDADQEFTIIRDGETITRTVTPKYDDNRGLHVVGLSPESLLVFADKPDELPEGIEPGMELVAIDSIPISAGVALGTGYFREGEVMNLTVREPGTSETVEVKVPARLSETEDNTFSLGIGIVKTLVSGVRSDAAVANSLGIRKGDIFKEINGVSVTALRGVLRRLFETKGKTLSVLVNRDGEDLLLKTDQWDERPVAFLNSLQMSYTDNISLAVFEGSPAAAAGLKNGDMLVSYAGKKLNNGMEGWNKFQELKEKAADRQETIVVQRNGQELTFGIAAAPRRDEAIKNVLNLRPSQERVELAFPESVTVGFDQAVGQFKSILMTLKSLFAGKVAAKNLGGIITIAVVSYTFVEQGLGKILFFMAILSLNLAVLNILPIPVLDGGHLMFLALEKIKGGPLSERVMGYANVVGLVFILGLMVFVTFHDIRRFFFN